MVVAAARPLSPAFSVMEPVVLRLRSLSPCPPELERRVLALGGRLESVAAKTLLQVEGAPVRRPRYLISGWACRYRHLSDGRRQIFDLVLPGEGVGLCRRAHPLANTSTVALTPLQLADAAPLLQEADPDGQLQAALDMQSDADERRALDQIVRLGRLTALERLAHLLIDLHRRLDAIGHVQDARFPFPLTQETLADMTGLSVVHVNRTLQELRRQQLAWVDRSHVRLGDRSRLAQLADDLPPGGT